MRLHIGRFRGKGREGKGREYNVHLHALTTKAASTVIGEVHFENYVLIVIGASILLVLALIRSLFTFICTNYDLAMCPMNCVTHTLFFLMLCPDIPPFGRITSDVISLGTYLFTGELQG